MLNYFASGFTLMGTGNYGKAVNNAYSLLDADKDKWVRVGDLKEQYLDVLGATPVSTDIIGPISNWAVRKGLRYYADATDRTKPDLVQGFILPEGSLVKSGIWKLPEPEPEPVADSSDGGMSADDFMALLNGGGLFDTS